MKTGPREYMDNVDRNKLTRLVWVDCPYPLLRVGLSGTLAELARVHAGSEVPDSAPDAVIFGVGGVEGLLEGMKRHRKLHPQAVVLVLGLCLDLSAARSVLRAGARGYIHAGITPDQIMRAVEIAMRGEIVAPRALLEYLISDPEILNINILSPRQREIMDLVVEGMSNAQIASCGLFRGGGRDSVKLFRLMDAEKASYPISLLCRVLKVSRSGYYDWKGRPPSKRTRENDALTENIREIHERSRETYGSPRVRAELRTLGSYCSRKRVARLMRQAGLFGCGGRRRKARTTLRSRTERTPPAPDLVKRNFAPEAPDRLWVADITYVRTWEGWLYLSFVLDTYSRRIVGWSMANNLRTELVLDAVNMAIYTRRPRPGLIHHSDRGSQYTSVEFGGRLREEGLLPSMGSVADAYDNAMAESFVSTLKRELIHRHSWPERLSARTAIFEYIEGFYNSRRRHSALGHLSPSGYEEARMGGDAVA